MGQVASNSGIARKLYDSAEKFVGHIPGGLAMTTVVGATLFKAMCGSTLATCATFAGIAVPEMKRHGYATKLSTGVVASVGTIGMLIPAEHSPHHIRDHHRAVDRQTLSRRSSFRGCSYHCSLYL